MSKYILSIDQGTTSSRAVLFTKDAQVYTAAQQEFQQYFPENGWVEHNPDHIWQTVISSAQKALADKQVKAEDIIAIGIANQRETTLVWNKKTGNLFITRLYGKTDAPVNIAIVYAMLGIQKW